MATGHARLLMKEIEEVGRAGVLLTADTLPPASEHSSSSTASVKVQPIDLPSGKPEDGKPEAPPLPSGKPYTLSRYIIFPWDIDIPHSSTFSSFLLY